MADFAPFAKAVKAQFDRMSANELYTVNITGDELYAAYLAAFPAGSNPIFRERTEHDCSCCRNFIKNIGNVVAIIDGKIVTVWDTHTLLPAPYAAVSGTLADLVRSKTITGLFRSSERSYGAESNKELLPDGKVRTWNHFHGNVAARHHTQDVGRVTGDFNTTVGVFRRGLDELTPEAFNTVIGLIEANALYRGEEHLNAVRTFFALQAAYRKLDAAGKELFIYSQATNPATRFRNTAIGTLLIDLSAGMDLEAAVKSFEQKVAPTNYKRTTALITPRMVEDAMKTIHAMGLEPALERRFARIEDVTMNNVLWADNSVKPMMKGGLADTLMAAATSKATIDDGKAEDISIEDFLANVLPKATGIDLMVRNSQLGNFISLTAPVHADAAPLFKWSNNFAWSYDGNITDAIKERVKAAGGSVEGDLLCRLAWDYTDDLDFHMMEPGGHRISFANRRRKSPNGGELDVDANGADGQRDDPVENIFYADRKTMREGVYTLMVNNYNRRSAGKGFEVQIEFDGVIHHFVHEKVLAEYATITVAEIRYSKAKGFEIINSLPGYTGAAKGQDKWGVKTETPVRVNTVMFSPNHWDGNKTGNRHVIFILEGCKNDLPTRGIYNEFLKPELEKHRKVFEVLGDKTKCQPVDNQLSGVGFSTTKGESVLVNVTGAKIRKTYNIKF